jgi:drug/metabolite transporter (DMT)-like permease
MAFSTENRRGIALMLLAMACYTLYDAFIKLAASHCTPGQILALRGACASGIVLALAAGTRALRPWRSAVVPIVGLRALLEVATAVTSVLALARMPLATVTALMMTAPLIVAACSMAVGMESRRADRLLAALGGFIGVLLVLRPFSTHASTAGLGFALACAVSLAARELVNRRLPAQLPSLLVATVTTLAVTACGFAMAAADRWQAPESDALAWIVAAAVFAALGNYAVVAASRSADLSAVAPFRYSAILWALALGYVLWADVPDGPTCAGIGLIGASSAYMLNAARR